MCTVSRCYCWVRQNLKTRGSCLCAQPKRKKKWVKGVNYLPFSGWHKDEQTQLQELLKSGSKFTASRPLYLTCALRAFTNSDFLYCPQIEELSVLSLSLSVNLFVFFVRKCYFKYLLLVISPNKQLSLNSWKGQAVPGERSSPWISVCRVLSTLSLRKPGIAWELNLERSSPKTEQWSWHPILLTTVELPAPFLA